MVVYSYHPKKADFTSWELTITYEPYDEYRRYKVYNYHKIARTTDETQLPENYAENIRYINKRRDHSVKKLEYFVNDVFRFGKYVNHKIEEVNNIKYTGWYYTNIEENTEHKKFIHDYLYNHFCEFRTDIEGHEYVVYPETIKRENIIKEKVNKFIDNIDTTKKYYLEPKSNPNHEGKIKINNITYTFPKVKEYYYEGYYYYLPICNGKSRRIKNKVIECNLMYFDNEIFITNFKIVK